MSRTMHKSGKIGDRLPQKKTSNTQVKLQQHSKTYEKDIIKYAIQHHDFDSLDDTDI